MNMILDISPIDQFGHNSLSIYQLEIVTFDSVMQVW